MRRTPLLAAGAFAALLAGCNPTNTYEVKGRVVGFGDDGRTVIVEHEDIPGLMDAMTMSFKTDGTPELERFEVGDAVGFSLVVSRDSAWIHHLERLPDSAVARSPAGNATLRNRVPGGTLVLTRGDAVPDFELVDQDGLPLRLSDYEGQTLVLTFIYTRCPIPTYCPLLSQRFEALQPRLKERFGTDVRLLSISIDPEHDTPAVLRDYARRYTSDTGTWTFATGTPEQVGRVAGLFGLYYEPGEGEISHSLTTAVIGPDGEVEKVWRDNRWEPADVVEAVARAREADVQVPR